jgi:hypothetical protein
MNNLNTQQLVLLTLLVSFVTSMATGIITVSLLEQTPDPITQTINRVVEKTIERVVPDVMSEEGKNPQTPEKEVVTVIVKEEDLTIDAVQKNIKSLVRIYNVAGSDKSLASLGFVVNESGSVVTDSSKIQSNFKYVIEYSEGEFDAEINFKENDVAYALLNPVNVSEGTKFTPASLGNSQNLKLAQSVISLSGASTNNVSTGIIRGLYTESGPLPSNESNPADQPTENFRLIETTIDPKNVLAGSIILNLQGNIVGIKIGSNLIEANDFRPINVLKDFLSSRQI